MNISIKFNTFDIKKRIIKKNYNNKYENLLNNKNNKRKI